MTSPTRLIVAEPYLWPTFLQWENLLNVCNQIVVIALIAVGMTMVINNWPRKTA